MKKISSKIDNKIILLFVSGIFFRIFAGLQSNFKIAQHDVIGDFGHFEYAKYIFKNVSLPMTNEWQFYHPPFNATLQALWMKIIKMITGIRNVDRLYPYCKYLSIFYSIVILIVIYLILKRLAKNSFVTNFSFFVLSIYPGLIFQATEYNNDPPATMFIFLSIYFAILWCQNLDNNKSYLYIIFLALSFSFGVLTKISTSIVAFIIGPMMLIKLIKRHDKKIFVQLAIFVVIAVPLSLSYIIRNYDLFGQSIFYVPEINAYKMDVSSYGLIDRCLSFPIDRLFFLEDGIYHDIGEYNIWVDLIKTATYDEGNYSGTVYHYFFFILYILNVVFHIVSLIAVIYNIYKLKTDNKNNLRNISLIIVFISLFSYIMFNLSQNMSCASNYRYIAYITFGFAALAALMISDFFNYIKYGKYVWK